MKKKCWIRKILFNTLATPVTILTLLMLPFVIAFRRASREAEKFDLWLEWRQKGTIVKRSKPKKNEKQPDVPTHKELTKRKGIHFKG